jgi:hypothetical protein
MTLFFFTTLGASEDWAGFGDCAIVWPQLKHMTESGDRMVAHPGHGKSPAGAATCGGSGFGGTGSVGVRFCGIISPQLKHITASVSRKVLQLGQGTWPSGTGSDGAGE